MDHNKRLAEIGFWALPPAGTRRREKLEANLESAKQDPKFKKRVKETFEKAQALVAVQSVTGAGFPADKQLREYNREYNYRVFAHTLWDMPGSFNVVEAFNKFLPPSATFELRNERDHLFSFQAFIDWVTSGEIETDQIDLESVLDEGIVYSFNSLDSPSALCFSISGGQEFGFASLSCVRFGCEVSVILVAGQKANLAEETNKIINSADGMKALNHRTHIHPDASLPLRAEPLIEGQDLWKTVVLVRFDIAQRTIDARYVFRDCGQSYAGITDDIDNFLRSKDEFLSDEIRQLYERATVDIKEYMPLFELSKTCLMLPKYFHTHDDDVCLERHPTQFREFRAKLKNKKTIERVDSRHHFTHRDVRVLLPTATRSPDRTAFVAPEYKIDKSGFWRSIAFDAEGRDKQDRPIHGRTWVNQTLSWIEEPSSQTSVCTKKGSAQRTGKNPGYIYVMRSAAHEKDIFKVGRTERTTDERARELSRSTSSPDHFLVVEEWATSDCIEAEKLIHDRLEQYRTNPNREYFRARYNIIFVVIDSVISQIDGASSN